LLNLQAAQSIHIGDANALLGELLEAQEVGFGRKMLRTNCSESRKAGCGDLLWGGECFSKGQGYFAIGVVKTASYLISSANTL
jgi:hypothetical protein